jgi:hypothetical protein
MWVRLWVAMASSTPCPPFSLTPPFPCPIGKVVGILSFLSLLGRTKKVACQYKETQYRPKVGRLGNGGFATAVTMVTKEPKRLKASASASAADSANLANLFANSSQFQRRSNLHNKDLKTTAAAATTLVGPSVRLKS